ncbi:hypothetical protein [Chachezhania sediminis]|uniref:hypothetical protein n=1 Tax=Chachezhania sediminis TaxID=2599291 RepID=UPI00131C79F1|nr:hypothetical protein [Chachezhania sediminis]
MTEGQFWIVCSLQGRAPRTAHDSREEAEGEAQELARQSPGRTFVVLEAVTGFCALVAPPQRLSLVECRPVFVTGEIDF